MNYKISKKNVPCKVQPEQRVFREKVDLQVHHDLFDHEKNRTAANTNTFS